MPIPSASRRLLRAAGLIHEQLVIRDRSGPAIWLPEDNWREATRLLKLIKLARQHGWSRAVVNLTRSLRRELEDTCQHLTAQLDSLRKTLAGRASATTSEIYRDLQALGEEFEDVECDLGAHELSVTTAAIVLDGLNLGRFQVRLDWRQLDGTSSYRIVALDPNPAQANDSVTHPHVSDERLCEGNGRRAIRAALDEGRLADFFTVVAQVLGTYAAGQAYVELDNWDGKPCHDCGSQVHEDDRCSCEACDELLCSDCVTYCGRCDSGYCSRCISECDACRETFCKSCLENCSTCDATRCRDCLTEGLCATCHDQAHEETKDDNEATPPGAAEPDAAVQPSSLGQAPVPA